MDIPSRCSHRHIHRISRRRPRNKTARRNTSNLQGFHVKFFFLYFFKTFEGYNLKPLRWFEIIVGITVLTLLVTYLIPSSPDFSITLVPRYVLSFIFITFLPGYCLVNILFLGKNKIDIVEQLVLSVALSFGLTGLIGLLLGLSPIGFSLNSITVSLSTLVLVLAVVALIRKNRELSGINV